jgi:hypothetical protein
MGSVILNSEVDSTTHLTISQDFRFILYFKCTLQNSDSTIIISQEGSFEIPVSHYMEDPGEYGTYKYYSGVIWFYPENTVKWGGKFNYGIDYNMVSFPDRPKLIANDKVGVLFWNWEK